MVTIRIRHEIVNIETDDMAYSSSILTQAFKVTDGRCHLCGKCLCFKNYGQTVRRGAWEIDHSKPKANGGTDHGNNLRPACIQCNRRKGKSSSQKARKVNGIANSPRSAIRKRRDGMIKGGLLGTAVYILTPPQFKLPAAIATGIWRYFSEQKKL